MSVRTGSRTGYFSGYSDCRKSASGLASKDIATRAGTRADFTQSSVVEQAHPVIVGKHGSPEARVAGPQSISTAARAIGPHSRPPSRSHPLASSPGGQKVPGFLQATTVALISKRHHHSPPTRRRPRFRLRRSGQGRANHPPAGFSQLTPSEIALTNRRRSSSRRSFAATTELASCVSSNDN